MTKEQLWMVMRVFAAIRGSLDAQWSFYGRESSGNRARADLAAQKLNKLRRTLHTATQVNKHWVWDELRFRKQYAKSMTSELRALGMPDPDQVTVAKYIPEIW